VNETEQISTLESLAKVANAREQGRRRAWLASIRVSPGGYLALASVLTFISGLLLRADRDLWSLIALACAWLVVPILAFADRIAFDGDLLYRRGPVPFLLRLISGRSQQLRISELEKVDTTALRTLRRAGRVRYRYRTHLSGKGTDFTFASGGRSYRRMVRQLFPVVADEKIDLRTRELRDYLCEPKLLQEQVKALQLAPAEVLDEAASDFKFGRPKQQDENTTNAVTSETDVERALQLRDVGNKLRVAGRLREAGEAFRRALNVIPRNGWLIYDFARLLRAQASALGDARLLGRARAALRLSAIRAESDHRLLSLIAESLIECGEPKRAYGLFQKAIDIEPSNYRARIGLADLALRDGKLAHVIHQYRNAAQSASEKALILYSRREADYYARLNDDDDYLSAELRRINWLQNSTRIRRLAARVTNASILVALAGPYLDSSIAGIGWWVASSSIVAWVSALFAIRILSERRKYTPAD
jgi:tetratricopeptide (TPR) repeat protein